HSLYGQTLADPKRLMAKLSIICNGLGDPIASELTAGDFTKYRPGIDANILIAVSGLLMTLTIFFGISALTILSIIAVPAIVILG
ncbi:hypothetical protein MJM59_29550, partial [Salmonella enterica subsp. enterica serovar Montevideo]|nr:hypothetical protein [Salmonella enterica subsp. enterica serovar Montevideo]